MKCLLDANALVALGFVQHEFHERINRRLAAESPSLLSCSITELGFVRVMSQSLTASQSRRPAMQSWL